MQRNENPRVIVRRVIDLLESELQGDGLSLLDVRVFRGGGRLQIRVYVDTEAGGINMAEVARASRSVSILMEEADLIEGQYVIEVSSPGIRRPLRTAEHYAAAVGQRVDLKVAGSHRSSRVRGILSGFDDGLLTVQPLGIGEVVEGTGEAEGGEAAVVPVTVQLKAIQEGNLDPDFDPQVLINADRKRRKEERRQARLQKPKSGRTPRPRKKRDPESPESGILK